MINRTVVELSLGVLALVAGLIGSYLISTNNAEGLPLFLVLTVALIGMASIVVASRLRTNQQNIHDIITAQLPTELSGQLVSETDLTIVDMIVLLGDHAEEQRRLLVQNFKDLMQGNVALPESLEETEHTLGLLRAELSALEDQYATDMNLAKPYRDSDEDDNNGYNFKPAA